MLDFTAELIESWLNPPKAHTYTHTRTHAVCSVKSSNFEGENKCLLNKAVIFILEAVTQSLLFVRAATVSVHTTGQVYTDLGEIHNNCNFALVWPILHTPLSRKCAACPCTTDFHNRTVLGRLPKLKLF